MWLRKNPRPQNSVGEVVGETDGGPVGNEEGLFVGSRVGGVENKESFVGELVGALWCEGGGEGRDDGKSEGEADGS